MFLLTYLFAREIIIGIKTTNFDFISLVVYVVSVSYCAFKINKLGKISNSKNN